MLIIFALLIFVIVIGIIGVYLAGLWQLFKKAGRQGWEAIIPFYNTWVLAEISGVAWWYALIIILSNFGILSDSDLGSILSLASIVANFFICYNLSKKFHQEVGMAILMAIFPIVVMPLMGFSNSYQYDKDVVVSENGPIGDNGNNNQSYTSEASYESNGETEEKRYCQYCGKQISTNAKFCGNCGLEVKK